MNKKDKKPLKNGANPRNIDKKSNLRKDENKKSNKEAKRTTAVKELNLSKMEESYAKILDGELDPSTLTSMLRNDRKVDKHSETENQKIGNKTKTDKASNTYKANKAGNSNKTGNTNKIVQMDKIGSKNKTDKAANGKNTVKSNKIDSGKKTDKLNKIDKAKNATTSKKKNNEIDCTYKNKCGGCSCIGVPYVTQLQQKQKKLDSLLSEFCKVNPIIGMENPYHYRNKVHAVVSHNKGQIITGVYKPGTHIVIPVENCLIEDEKADEIIASIRVLMKSFKMKSYDEDSGYGFLRHILIKRGFSTNQIMVVLVTGSPIFPSKNNFVKALLKLHPDITTIIHNVNDKKTNMVLGEQEKVMYGKGFIEDILCGYVFRISSKSFYQINPVQTEVLYNKAIELAKLTKEDAVIDTYSGIGTIGIVASKHAKEVIGVELNKDAVRDAIANAKRNDISNIEFYQSDSSEFMTKLAEQGKSIDVIFIDPPRSGSTEQFMDALGQLAPKRVVYISCNPETLARDLKYLKKKGYKAETAYGVDMFPFTEHVESIILMTYCGSKKK